jgi:hypothetical protein
MKIIFFDKAQLGSYYMSFLPSFSSDHANAECLKMLLDYLDETSIEYTADERTTNYAVIKLLDMDDFVLLKLTFQGRGINEIIQIITPEKTT